MGGAMTTAVYQRLPEIADGRVADGNAFMRIGVAASAQSPQRLRSVRDRTTIVL